MFRIAIVVLALTAIGPLGRAVAQPLVDGAWVSAHACDPGIVVLDLRESPRAVARGHVPCAVHAPYSQSGWRTTRDNVPGMLPRESELEALIGGLGISADKHVVLVSAGGDAGQMTPATRVYWTLKVAGHDPVSILDGGMAAYRLDPNNKLAQGEPAAPKPARFTVNLRRELIADAGDVALAIESGKVLVDNRESDAYVGINKSPVAQTAGTLPGARNLPISWLTTQDGRFHKRQDLEKIAALIAGEAGDDADQINFCNTGQMASLGWFVSHELLNNDKARIYDGSMSDWTAVPSRPVEKKVGVVGAE